MGAFFHLLFGPWPIYLFAIAIIAIFLLTPWLSSQHNSQQRYPHGHHNIILIRHHHHPPSATVSCSRSLPVANALVSFEQPDHHNPNPQKNGPKKQGKVSFQRSFPMLKGIVLHCMPLVPLYSPEAKVSLPICQEASLADYQQCIRHKSACWSKVTSHISAKNQSRPQFINMVTLPKMSKTIVGTLIFTL